MAKKHQFGRRLLALALSGCLLLGLTACGGGDTDTETTTTEQGTTTTASSSAAATADTEYGYKTTVTTLDVDIDWSNGMSLAGDKLYLMSERYDDTAETYCVYILNTDGSVDGQLTLPTMSQGWYQSVVAGNGCIWAVTYEWVQDETGDVEETPSDDWTTADPSEPAEEPDDSADPWEEPDDWTTSDVGDAADWGREADATEEDATETDATEASETEDEVDVDTDWIYEDDVMADEYTSGRDVYRLLQFDTTGQLLSTTELTGPDDMDYFYVNSIKADAAGNLYLRCDNHLMVYDDQVQLLATVVLDNWISEVIPMPDGQVLVQYYNEDYVLTTGQLDTTTWEITGNVEIEVPNDNYSYTYYVGGDSQLYASSTAGLYRCNLQNGTLEELLQWLDCDVNCYNSYGTAILSEDMVLSVGADDLTGEIQLTTLERVPADQLPQKIELTMGVTWLSYNTRKVVLNFNRTNTDYRITVKDYSVYNTETDYNAAQTQMERDMISGNCPDILYLDSINDLETYVSKGILTDLYTLMGADTVEKDDLVASYRRIMEVDGGLYAIYPSFSVETMVAAADTVGTESGWTLAEFAALVREYADRDAVIWDYQTRDDVLTMLLCYNYDTFVDRETGQCSFDGAEFQSLLETCSLFPEDYDYYSDYYENVIQYDSYYDQLRDGQPLVASQGIYALDDMRYQLDALADDLTFIGIPGVEGNGAVLSATSGYAISASSAHQDVAWQFLATMLTEDYADSNVYNLSILQSYLDQQAEAATENPYYIDANGEKVEYGDEVLTQAQVDALMDTIDNIQGRYIYDEALIEIVQDEAAAYFAGQKTAEDVAKLIQNRAQTYLDEQR